MGDGVNGQGGYRGVLDASTALGLRQMGGLTVAAISAVFTSITSHNYSVRTMTRNRANLSLLFVSFGAAPHLS